VEFSDAVVAEVYAQLYREVLRLDVEESTVMPLVQYLIEFGTRTKG
jgi:hypothetical protein